ncbi:hypothetical protein VA596_40780 [Amycolatopsis sp., V23-08]|uniref:Gram-positive cocci surface proteins LPxTG domain-containing protein n=1 Tax=Amycolatopsis heterodermiae TaxID=3110235 RepID=A0ABU5RK17_9PSEU|nr:hypothetical protein [Amycolatopsis sp., V23-08]MEA5365919.1 hypothetical protein [Amycolatopsis sp., V23-08]
MKNTAVVAGVAAAFLVLAPTAALAADTPSAPATATTKPEYPDGPMTRVKKQLTVSPSKARPGARVNFDFGCSTWPNETVSIRSAAVVPDKPGFASGTVANVKPGKYSVTLHCGIETSTTSFEVLPAAGNPAPKQVAKVPAGAPQTGGTDAPDGGSDAPLAAAAAMGVLAVGGSGLVLARRARRR